MLRQSDEGDRVWICDFDEEERRSRFEEFRCGLKVLARNLSEASLH